MADRIATAIPRSARFAFTGTTVTAPLNLPRNIVDTAGVIEVKAPDMGIGGGNLRSRGRNEAATARRDLEMGAVRRAVAALRGEPEVGPLLGGPDQGRSLQ